MMGSTAIVLFSLGGPDRPEAVRPFLFNLFNDPAIIALPRWPRWALAHLLAWRRAKKARAIYAKLGGASPILANSVAQGLALSRALKDPSGFKVFVAMRYWKPLIPVTLRAVKEMTPSRVVLLPLYPQFSTTTTGSSYRAWVAEAMRQGLDCPQHLVCCYALDQAFVGAVADLTREGLAEAKARAPKARPLIIFSAHGLPKKIIDKGDPYQAQIEASALAVVARLDLAREDWIVAYQSRVGPMQWIGPATDEIIVKAAREARAIVLVPIAFVSEHSETLVELDIDYRQLAERNRAPAYVRVPTVGTHPKYIAGLAALVLRAMEGRDAIVPGAGNQSCAGQAGCARGAGKN